MLDDEVVWWAVRCWAAWDGQVDGAESDFAVSLRRHALRLVRRQQPWMTKELVGPKTGMAARMIRERLSDPDDPLYYECYLDKMSTWPYKDPVGAVRAGTDAEQAYFEDIHVLQDGQAVPIQEAANSEILGALSGKWGKFRFHYDREYSSEFTGLLDEFGVC